MRDKDPSDWSVATRPPNCDSSESRRRGRRIASCIAGTWLTLFMATASAQAPGDSAVLAQLKGLLQERKFAEIEGIATTRLAELQSTSLEVLRERAQILNVVVESRQRMGQRADDEALQFADQVVECNREAFGEESILFATSLELRSMLLVDLSRFDGAAAGFERAVAIRRRSERGDLSGLGMTMNRLATAYRRLGESKKAEALLGEALDMLRKATPRDESMIASVSLNLAGILQERGELSKARVIYERAHSQLLALHGARHPLTLKASYNIANVSWKQGDYLEAQALLEDFLASAEEAGPAVAGDVFRAHNIHCNVLAALGSSEKAAESCQNAIAQGLKLLPPDHPEIAMMRLNLSQVLAEAGRFAEALEIAVQATSVITTKLPEGNPFRIQALLHEALTRVNAGDLTNGLAIAQSAMHSAEQLLEKDHPVRVMAAMILSNAYARGGRLRESRDLLSHYEPFARSLGGPTSVGTLEFSDRLAARSFEVGDYQIACNTALDVEKRGREQAQAISPSLESSLLMRYAATRRSGMNVLLNCAHQLPNDPISNDVFQALVRSRALVLDEMAEHLRLSAHATAGDEVSLARVRWNDAVARESQVANQAGNEAAIPDAQAARKEAEEELKRLLGSTLLPEREAAVSTADVIAAIPEDAVLVSLASYAPPPDRMAPNQTSRTEYMAFVSHRGDATPKVVPLPGTEDSIDSLVRAWHATLRPIDDVDGSVPDEAATRAAGGALRKQIWDPLVPHLHKARLVLVVPDGALQGVSFAALPSGDAKYLADSGIAFQYLSAERDLIRAVESSNANRGALFVRGDLQPSEADEIDALSRVWEGNTIHFWSLGGGALGFLTTMLAWRRKSPLGPRSFVRGVIGAAIGGFVGLLGGEALAGAVVLSPPSATESAIRREAPGRDVIHISAHGSSAARGTVAKAGSRRVARNTDPWQPPGASSEHAAMLEIGVVLGGAAKDNAAADDGVFSAAEIATLDLHGTRWVVLSSCSSGLGLDLGIEGQLGLRRAIRIAGAHTAITSLWPVRSNATEEWMTTLYEFRRAGASTASAVRDAHLKVLNDRRRSKRSTHPYFWGAFVSEGDWR